MFRPAVTVTILLLLLSSPVRAESLVIPLPELLGTHNDEVTIPLQLPRTPIAIYGASFRLAGTAQTGTRVCYEGDPGDWAAIANIFVHDGHYWPYWIVGTGWIWTSGPISVNEACTPVPLDTTWDFLLDGTGYITLSAGAAGGWPECHPTSPPPTVTVTEAVFVIEGEFELATEATTWGKVKALYR